MKEKVLFGVAVLSSILYIIFYQTLSPEMQTLAFTVLSVIIIIAYWNIKNSNENSKFMIIGIWITIACAFFIPNFLLESDLNLPSDGIWSIILVLFLLIDVSREFEWFSKSKE